MVSLKIDTKKLKNTIQFLKSTFKEKRGEVVTCNFTVTQNGVSIVIPSGSIFIECETSGTCFTEIPFTHVYNIVNDIIIEVSEISIYHNTFKINNVMFNVKTVDYENSNPIQPIYFKKNYTELALLKLKNKGTTVAEFKARQIYKELLEAEDNLNIKINRAYNNLKLYGFTKDEIVELVNQKLSK